ncbi:hypothetical protein L3X38_026985 [Prunus dulcis]|uniref:Uncharacterized protein n=1 Tax=Prunus dulcis TaxID=3755 RepID=A0AAD4VNJ0_PRUDU|nr:hypothetical protein L3X38_026985 [Prunus dulcis]
MSDLIRRHRAVTTTQSAEHPTQPISAATDPASAATAPALIDHLVVGPAGSQAPASSASSVAQPVSARRRHRPASTTDTTSTDASGSQPENNILGNGADPTVQTYRTRISPNRRKSIRLPNDNQIQIREYRRVRNDMGNILEHNGPHTKAHELPHSPAARGWLEKFPATEISQITQQYLYLRDRDN